MSTPSSTIGDFLQVGSISYPLIDFLSLFPGRSTINGPAIFGIHPIALAAPTANAMFGPGVNPGCQISLESIGFTHIYGILNNFGMTNTFGVSNIFGITNKFSISSKFGLDIKQVLNLGNGPTVLNAGGTINGSVKINGILEISGSFASDYGFFEKLDAIQKNFNIPHPSKSGYRLVHGCLEGPENGVYYRGRLQDSTQIILPDYWEKLINPETINVFFTPNRFYQELFVKSIEWGKVINVGNNSGGSIDCYYIVYAERIDVDKLKVEVKE